MQLPPEACYFYKMDDEFESVRGLDDFTVSLRLMVRDISRGKEVIPRDPECGKGFAIVDEGKKLMV